MEESRVDRHLDRFARREEEVPVETTEECHLTLELVDTQRGYRLVAELSQRRDRPVAATPLLSAAAADPAHEARGHLILRRPHLPPRPPRSRRHRCARGDYGTAFEIALKIRELSGAQFEAFSSADLLHGPIAAVKAGRPAIVIAPSGRTLASMAAAVEDVRKRGSEVMAISDDRDFLAAADTAFPLVADVPEWLSPLLTVVPGQVAAVRLATLQGADVESPAGLTKITLTH